MNLKEIFTPFAERAKSPLYSAFIVSWLIWNWRIIFAILFFKRQDYLGYDLADFIYYKYVNTLDIITWPLISALIYLIIMPWIDLVVIWYIEKLKGKKMNVKLKEGKRYFVDGKKYFDLLLKYENQTGIKLKSEDDLITVRIALDEEKQQNKTYNYDINKLHGEKNEIERKYNLLFNRSSIVRVFQGRWTLTYTEKDGANRIEQVNIKGNEYRKIEHNAERVLYFLHLVDCDVESKNLSFVKFIKEGQAPHAIVKLNMVSDDIFEGFENENIPVTYVRSKFTMAEQKKNWEIG